MRFALSLITLLFSSFVFANQMVVTENAIASRVGSDILKQGGNAIDAAVAVGYALAVVNPCCGNIGGGGFMTIHFANGQNVFVNFREKAPLKATEKMYIDDLGKMNEDAATKGYLAVAVPGTVMGLDTVLKKYGKLSRQKVMAPAIKLAKDGYRVGKFDAKLFAQYANDFSQQQNIAAIFLQNGKPYQLGETLKQTELANTLQLISDQGADVFYKGAIAKKIVAASDKNGGILSEKDFNDYSISFNQPLQCSYHQYTILSAPPPSSGGITLCEILNILEKVKLNTRNSAEDVHMIVEAMRYGFLDRNSQLGDPDFVKNPIEKLTSKKYAHSIYEKILKSKVLPQELPAVKRELTDTTHYSIVDKDNNAVSVTYTINGFFGARVMAENTGFFLNDEMDDFSAQPGVANKFGLVMTDTNKIEAGKRPLSSMTPTIILKNGKLFMVIGSPGGPRIITSVLLTLINYFDYHLTLKKAVNAPRYHYQANPDILNTEPEALPNATLNKLENMGYKIAPQTTWGAVEAIVVDSKGILRGVNDKRRPDGAAI